MKEKHKQARELANQLVRRTNIWMHHAHDGRNPGRSTVGRHDNDLSQKSDTFELQDGNNPQKRNVVPFEKIDNPLIVASKMGVTEMVEIILYHWPMAVHNVDSNGKNVVQIAVENRQRRVYDQLLLNNFSQSAFRHTDHEGNSALHLAATLSNSIAWQINPGLQLQLEIKWFQHVKNSVSSNFFARYNNEGQTAEEVFTKTHKELVQQGSKWLAETSQSCSVVATFIAPVAFSTSATVPSGIKEQNNNPTFQEHLAFILFAVSSLSALCFSIISLIIFLSIIHSQHREEDFSSRLPKKFLVALTSLLIAIISTFVSFCSTHFLIVKENIKFEVYPLYSILFAVVTLIVMSQFPMYWDFIRSSLSEFISAGHRKSKAKTQAEAEAKARDM